MCLVSADVPFMTFRRTSGSPHTKLGKGSYDTGTPYGAGFAAVAAGKLGRHQRDAAPLLPDRGQGEDGTLAVQEPLVARYALRHHSRALHRPDPLRSIWQRDLRHLL